MKLISKLLLLCLSLLTSQAIFSQAEAELLNFNQDHGDHLVCGLSKDVVLEHSTPPLKILSDYPSSAQFDCGKFKVFYADLLPGAPAGGFGDPALGATRRSTLCAVLNYVESVFDLSNVPNHSIRIEVEPSWITTLNPTPTSVEYYAYAGPNYSVVAANTIVGGKVYDYITTGLDPALSSEFHGYMKVNFDSFGPTQQNIVWLNDYTQNVPACHLDLFYVLLHEVGHMLGFASLANNDGVLYPTSLFVGNNNFSRLDFLLHYSGNTNNTATSLQKLISGNATSATLNPALGAVSLTTNRFWIKGNAAPNNHPVYSGGYNGSTYRVESLLSHLDEQILSYSFRSRNAPGYADDYVMSPFGIPGVVRRKFTDAEIKIFIELGYSLNPSYVNPGLNNLPPYSSTIGNDPNYQNSFDIFPQSMYAETVNANQIIINDLGAFVTFNLWQDAGIADPEGQPITVADGTLTNIRGCGNGGNNHAQLALSADKKTIIFTPRANFIGRAQFAFRLFDGTKIGSWHLYTVDVLTGTNVNYPVGSNILINGNLEEGTEVRRPGAEINKAHTSIEASGVREGFMRGYHYSDANPLNSLGNGWMPYGAGDFIRNAADICTIPYGTGTAFGIGTNSCPDSYYLNPIPNLNDGDRYRTIYSPYNYFGLGTPVQTCHKYILKFDYANKPQLYNLNLSSYPVTFGFTNGPTFPGLPTVVNTFSDNLTPIPIDTWMHKEIPFDYCAQSSSNFLNIKGFAESYKGLLFDNIQIVEVVDFPQLTVSIDGTSDICIGGSTTLTATIDNEFCNPTYLWSNGMTTASITVAPNATQTYSVTVSDCYSSQTVDQVVTVNPTSVISISPPLTTIPQGGSVALSASGAVSYSWSPSNGLSCTNCPNPIASPNTSTTYTVTGTNAIGCTSTSTAQVNLEQIVSCSNCPNTLSSNLTSSSIIPAKQTYCVNNNVNISGNVLFRTSEFRMASNVTIFVQQGATLTIQGCHLYSCGDMWKGIVVLPGGRLVIENGMTPGWPINYFNSFIEDAVTAVKIENTTLTTNVLKVTDVLFNRNQNGIKIINYNINQATYPFDIRNCIFTSRKIGFGNFNPNIPSPWPLTSTVRATTNIANNLGNDYISNINFSQVHALSFLKAPFAGEKPKIGLELINVGLTQNVGTTNPPSYSEFILGGLNNMTIFDNHNTGVRLTNSNFKTVNTVFQNTPGKGVGIYAESDDNNINRLQVLPIQTVLGGNRFVDCGTAIRTQNYFENNIQYSDVRSTQANGDQTSTKYGFQLNTNRFYAYNIRYNNMYNVTSAVMINTDNGFFNLNGTQIFGQFAGTINVDYNTIRPHLATATNLTSQYVANAITLSNSSSSVATHLINGAPPVISTNNNWIRACRGIFYTNWKRYNVQCQNNNITVLNNINAVPGFNHIYYGIDVSNSYEASANGCFIRQNNVTGFYTQTSNPSTINDPNLTGIVTSLCSRFNVTCNKTSNTTRGIGFNGANNSTLFTNNSMQGHRYGFFLDQAGFIANPQGSVTAPADNKWTGTWLPNNYKTAALGSSYGFNSQMYVRIGTNTATYNPNLSSISLPVITPNFYYQLGGNLLGSPLSAPIFDFSCIQLIPFPFFLKNLEKIAQDSIIYSDVSLLGEKMRYIGKNMAYEAVKFEGELTDSSNILLDFYNNNLVSAYEKIYQIQKQMSQGDLIGASLSNSIFNPENNIEENYKKYNEIWIKDKEGTSMLSDSSNLIDLARKCPFTDGAIVYQARALYNRIFDVKEEFVDICDEGVGAKSMMMEDESEVNSNEILLYPNPTEEDVNIKTVNFDVEMVNVEVYDASGKLVYANNEISIVKGEGNFRLNVKNGIYLVRIYNRISDGYSVQKLIINK